VIRHPGRKSSTAPSSITTALAAQSCSQQHAGQHLSNMSSSTTAGRCCTRQSESAAGAPAYKTKTNTNGKQLSARHL
jgi:hypothetical protein